MPCGRSGAGTNPDSSLFSLGDRQVKRNSNKAGGEREKNDGEDLAEASLTWGHGGNRGSDIELRHKVEGGITQAKLRARRLQRHGEQGGAAAFASSWRGQR